MTNISIIEKESAAIKMLLKFRSHISTIKIAIGLPNVFADEIITKINDKIELSERAIQG